MNNLNNKKGFTLIEVLLYVLITGVIVFSISIFIQLILEARVKNQAIAEVNSQGIQVLQTLDLAIREATAINTPTQGNSGAALSLAMATGAKNPTLFDLSGGAIRIKEGTGANVNLTSSRVTVSGLNFSNLSRNNTPGIVRVQFVITHNNPTGRSEYSFAKTFSGSFGLR